MWEASLRSACHIEHCELKDTAGDTGTHYVTQERERHAPRYMSHVCLLTVFSRPVDVDAIVFTSCIIYRYVHQHEMIGEIAIFVHWRTSPDNFLWILPVPYCGGVSLKTLVTANDIHQLLCFLCSPILLELDSVGLTIFFHFFQSLLISTDSRGESQVSVSIFQSLRILIIHQRLPMCTRRNHAFKWIERSRHSEYLINALGPLLGAKASLSDFLFRFAWERANS